MRIFKYHVHSITGNTLDGVVSVPDHIDDSVTTEERAILAVHTKIATEMKDSMDLIQFEDEDIELTEHVPRYGNCQSFVVTMTMYDHEAQDAFDF
tara:strand:+ start:1483 stop:1767 length:285 start_codon:yes stop_codon:yes gene_type:complete